MSTTVPDLPPIVSRFDFAFAGHGRWATCLAAHEDTIVLERWNLARPVPVPQTLAGEPPARLAVDRRSRALPLDDGRVLIARPAPDASARDLSGTVVETRPARTGPTIVRTWTVPAMLDGRLLAGPGPDQVVLLITIEDASYSRIWRLPVSSADAAPVPEPVLRIPGTLSDGVWLDDRRTLALGHSADGRRPDAIVVDLRERAWRRVWSVAATTTDRIAAYGARSGVLAVTTTSPGAQPPGTSQIGLRFPGGGPVRFPEALNRPDRARTPLTFDDGGERLLVAEARGATSGLAIYDPASDRITSLPGPRGILSAPACWTGDRIHVRFSAPHQPPTLATMRHRPPRGWTPGSRPRRNPDRRWRGADLVELPGPAGGIEAVVYGGPGWRLSPRLVLALHGGPLSAWRFEFDALFQHLAAAGVAVAAPNQRGSTGYGERHLRAVIGDWGGSDLDDVLHLGRALARTRSDAGLPGPVLLGGSYGAYLALLAACRDPEPWSGCVALAPFTSAESLARCASAAVGERVSRLGRSTSNGNGGGRDVLRVCEALTAPLLLAHGTRDEIIPAGQSRALRERLLELGRTEGVDFEYLEVDDGHQDVVQAWPPVLREAVVRFCLAAERIVDRVQGGR
ncbi:alpha/beta hydrolase family protein [Actinomadura roseirufa]|uniref:alpha/beta hydrolase family protein n=1 Tax=Actinomadura roseirufa TaxID=2094049 RepID=UPI0010419D22|nr:alpha/beta fold hydrolase [Actinomadura roseirufa]